jgi:coatomer protein complex subunit alpha (xenin)
VVNNIIFCITRTSEIVEIPFDPTEFKFKLALINRDYKNVFHMIETSNLMGQSIIGYLQKKGYPEVFLN